MANLVQDLPNPMLLAVKLNMPRSKANLISRLPLLNRLAKGLTDGVGFFLLSAPAGYGKTTLVCQWLNKQSLSHTWFSLDEKDNDPAGFMIYLLAAIRKIIPEAGRITQSLLNLAQFPPVNRLITPLLNDLTDLKEPLVIIFDDYHLIRNRYIHEIIQFIIDHRLPLLHLVLITRETPPLALARMRAGGVTTELGENDLRFSEAETAAFMADTMRLNLKEEVVTLLCLVTEGWVAGLQLAALLIQGYTSERIDDFVIELSNSNHYIIDYLVSEVMAGLPGEIRDFLRQTAVLNYLCAPLCNTVTGRKDSQKLLKLLACDNFFLCLLDEEEQWYQYHQLFADSIREGLNPAERRTVQQKAARWHEVNGYPEETLGEAITVVDFTKAERLIRLKAPNSYGAFRDDGSLISLTSLTSLKNRPVRSKYARKLRPAVIENNLNSPRLITNNMPASMTAPLSNRERELLRLVAEGLSNEEIARALSISLSTTKCHIHNIFQKLGVNSRTKAAKMAEQFNLI